MTRNHSKETTSLLQTGKDGHPVDVIQKTIGTLGRWHIWICLAIFLVKFPVAWHQLSIVFVAPPVSFSCIDNTTYKCSPNCSSHVFDRSVFTETIVTQWDLVCERAQLANFAQTVTMLGILVGNILIGTLSDRYGRRSPLVWSVIVQIITGVAAAFSPWFALFLVMRFLSACAIGGTMVTSFVLIMELVGTKWRTAMGVLYQIPFNLGHLSLALFGYLLRDWRYFQLAISLPPIILVSYFWFLPESPRWLLAVGRTEDAVKVLEKAAHHNRLPTTTIKGDIATYTQKKEANQTTRSASLVDLFRTPNLRNKTIYICFNWIVCGLCFFGVAQFIGQLGGNIFINVAFSAATQIPGTLFSIWSMRVLGRRYTLIGANVMAGVTLLLVPVVPRDPALIRSTLACIGMFGLSVSFPTVYIFSGELFPTVVRNIGMGTSSMCARFGSMSAPFVAGLAEFEHWLPPLIFGISPLIGAAMCYLLPETVGCELPDTLEEAEEFGKKSSKADKGIKMNHTDIGSK